MSTVSPPAPPLPPPRAPTPGPPARPPAMPPEVRWRWLQDATPTKQSPAAADEFVQPQSGFGKLVVLVQIVLLVLFGLLVDQEWSQVCPNGIAEVCGVPSSAASCTATDASAVPAPDCTFTDEASCDTSVCTYTAAVAHDPAKYAAAEQRYYKIYLDVAIMMLVRDARCLRASPPARAGFSQRFECAGRFRLPHDLPATLRPGRRRLHGALLRFDAPICFDAPLST